MAAGGGDLERAPGLVLAAHVGQVGAAGQRAGGGGQGRRRARQHPVPGEVGVDREQVVAGMDAGGGGAGGLRAVGGGHEQGAARRGRGQAGGEHAGNRAQLAGEGELAEEFLALQRGQRDEAVGGEDAEGDGQVEAAAFLGQVRRRQVDGDVALRELEAGVEQRGAHAVLALAHGGLGQADDGKAGQAGAEVDLDGDGGGFQPQLCARAHDGERHPCLLRPGRGAAAEGGRGDRASRGPAAAPVGAAGGRAKQAGAGGGNRPAG